MLLRQGRQNNLPGLLLIRAHKRLEKSRVRIFNQTIQNMHKCSGGKTPFCQATNRQMIRKRTMGGIEFDLGYVCAELEFRFTIFFLPFCNICHIYLSEHRQDSIFSSVWSWYRGCLLLLLFLAGFLQTFFSFFLSLSVFLFWCRICIALCCYFDESMISLTSLLWQDFK